MSSEPLEQELAYQTLGKILYTSTWRYLQHAVHQEQLAEDASQEALELVHARLERDLGPDDPNRFVSWAISIALNKVREHFRRQNPPAGRKHGKRIAERNIQSLDAPQGADERPLQDRLVDRESESFVDDMLQGQELDELLREVLKNTSISEKSRYVLLRGFIEGLDDDELAKELNTTRGNVHVIRCRDLAKLRQDDAFMAKLAEIFGK